MKNKMIQVESEQLRKISHGENMVKGGRLRVRILESCSVNEI